MVLEMEKNKDQALNNLRIDSTSKKLIQKAKKNWNARFKLGEKKKFCTYAMPMGKKKRGTSSDWATTLGGHICWKAMGSLGITAQSGKTGGQNAR